MMAPVKHAPAGAGGSLKGAHQVRVRRMGSAARACDVARGSEARIRRAWPCQQTGARSGEVPCGARLGEGRSEMSCWFWCMRRARTSGDR